MKDVKRYHQKTFFTKIIDSAIFIFMRMLSLTTILVCCLFIYPMAQENGNDAYTLYKAARVFDGEQMHPAWMVLVKGNRIVAAGNEASIQVPPSAKIIN